MEDLSFQYTGTVEGGSEGVKEKENESDKQTDLAHRRKDAVSKTGSKHL